MTVHASLLMPAVIAWLALSSCTSDKHPGDRGRELVKNPMSASHDKKSKRIPVFSFSEEAFDFGNVIQGEKVIYSFGFTNTGNADLVIASATAGCGCVVAEYPKNPIPPGEERIIRVIFNTESRSGYQNKTVTLVANTIPNTKILKLLGNVIIPNKNVE